MFWSYFEKQNSPNLLCFGKLSKLYSRAHVCHVEKHDKLKKKEHNTIICSSIKLGTCSCFMRIRSTNVILYIFKMSQHFIVGLNISDNLWNMVLFMDISVNNVCTLYQSYLNPYLSCSSIRPQSQRMSLSKGWWRRGRKR